MKSSPFPFQIDISKCHYLVDLDTMRETPWEPNYSSNKEEWISLAHRPFLDASRYVTSIVADVLISGKNECWS